jgi:hypothetical protein
MNLLVKKVADKNEPRKDNSDKLPVFDKTDHPRTANEYKDEWAFIDDEKLRQNIAYAMQWMEWQTKLYNKYQMYLTIEAHHLKGMILNIASVMEAATKYMVEKWSKKAGHSGSYNTFGELIRFAVDADIISPAISRTINELRRVRNNVHLYGIIEREYELYTVEKVNEYLRALENFRVHLLQ